jgi:hypothetical protein
VILSLSITFEIVALGTGPRLCGLLLKSFINAQN